MSLFGGSDKKAIKAQQKENALTRDFLEKMSQRARSDIFSIWPGVPASRIGGYGAAINALGQAIPQSIDVYQQGNVGAQAQLLAGLDQFQNAIYGLPVDTSGWQPQQLDVGDLSWLGALYPEQPGGGEIPGGTAPDGNNAQAGDSQTGGVSGSQGQQNRNTVAGNGRPAGPGGYMFDAGYDPRFTSTPSSGGRDYSQLNTTYLNENLDWFTGTGAYDPRNSHIPYSNDYGGYGSDGSFTGTNWSQIFENAVRQFGPLVGSQLLGIPAPLTKMFLKNRDLWGRQQGIMSPDSPAFVDPDGPGWSSADWASYLSGLPQIAQVGGSYYAHTEAPDGYYADPELFETYKKLRSLYGDESNANDRDNRMMDRPGIAKYSGLGSITGGGAYNYATRLPPRGGSGQG